MPKLSDSNPPAPPQDAQPKPPSIWDWEKHPAFRETFLYLFRPEDRENFTHLGRLLYDLIIEAPSLGDDDPESSTRAELKAAALDLHHLGAFLASVGREHEVSSLDLRDERLSRAAGPWAVDVVRIAVEISAALETYDPEDPSGPAVRFRESR